MDPIGSRNRPPPRGRGLRYPTDSSAALGQPSVSRRIALQGALPLIPSCSDSSRWAACRKEVARWEWGRGIPNPRSELPCTEITYIARTPGPRRRDFAGSAMCAGRNPPGVSRSPELHSWPSLPISSPETRGLISVLPSGCGFPRIIPEDAGSPRARKRSSTPSRSGVRECGIPARCSWLLYESPSGNLNTSNTPASIKACGTRSPPKGQRAESPRRLRARGRFFCIRQRAGLPISKASKPAGPRALLPCSMACHPAGEHSGAKIFRAPSRPVRPEARVQGAPFRAAGRSWFHGRGKNHPARRRPPGAWQSRRSHGPGNSRLSP